MKVIKCPCCGANLNSQISKKANICEYCGSTFDKEEKIQTSIDAQKSIIQALQQSNSKIPPRPVFNSFIFIILLFISFIPAIIYAIIISSLQKEWDKKYGKQ